MVKTILRAGILWILCSIVNQQGQEERRPGKRTAFGKHGRQSKPGSQELVSLGAGEVSCFIPTSYGDAATHSNHVSENYRFRREGERLQGGITQEACTKEVSMVMRTVYGNYMTVLAVRTMRMRAIYGNEPFVVKR